MGTLKATLRQFVDYQKAPLFPLQDAQQHQFLSSQPLDDAPLARTGDREIWHGDSLGRHQNGSKTENSSQKKAKKKEEYKQHKHAALKSPGPKDEILNSKGSQALRSTKKARPQALGFVVVKEVCL